VTYPRNLERLCKWRVLLTGWQLGTRPKGDPECDAVRDHREATLILRAEVTALTHMLRRAGIVTVREMQEAVEAEADALSMALETRFPGVRATDSGLELDERAAETMKGWRP